MQRQHRGGFIRNITARNIRVEGKIAGFGNPDKRPVIWVQSNYGCEDIHCTSTEHNPACPQPEPLAPTRVSGISFENVTGWVPLSTPAGVLVGLDAPGLIEGISFKDIDLVAGPWQCVGATVKNLTVDTVSPPGLGAACAKQTSIMLTEDDDDDALPVAYQVTAPPPSPIQDHNGQPLLLAACDAAAAHQQFKLAPSAIASSELFQSNDGSHSIATGQPFCVSLNDCNPSEVSLYDCKPATDCSNHSAAHFRWTRTTTGTFVNQLSGTCLAAVSGIVPTATCVSGSAAQHWASEAGSFRHQSTGLCLSSDTTNRCAAEFSGSCLNSSTTAACGQCVTTIAARNASRCNDAETSLLRGLCNAAPYKPALERCTWKLS